MAAKSQTDLNKPTRAEASIIVRSSKAKSYDQTVSPALVEIGLSESFSGDIEGESPVRALQVLERQGTFVLQSSEVVEHGQIRATWCVVPLVGAALASPASLASDVPAAARRVTACTGSGVPPVRLLVG